MNNITQISGRENSRRAEIEAQARTWVIRLDGDPGKEEVIEFRSWLRESPLHREIFRQASETWNDMDRMSDIYFSHVDSRPRNGYLSRFTSNRFIYSSGIAAVCLVLAATVTTFMLHQNTENDSIAPGSASIAYKTTIGEIRTVLLPDGTNVKMNTGTSMIVSYGNQAD